MRFLVLALAALFFAGAEARVVHVACTDGDASCDVDRACDRACTFALCRVPCLVAPCPDVFTSCPPERMDATPVRLALGQGRRARRQVSRLGETRLVLRCRAARNTSCKPALTTGCRSDLGADACAEHDGDYGVHGLSGQPTCLCRTDDASAPCTRTTDCEGICLAVDLQATSGQCSVHVVEFGCFVRLDDEGRAQGLCVD
jgi:hypothetical protein